MDNKIKLTPYDVAYLDILGSKNLIKSKDSEFYLNAIKKVFNEVIVMIETNYLNNYKLKPKLKIFSDNIIIAIPKTEFMETSIDTTNSCYIMIFAAFFQMIALKYSLLVRGSIVSDELYIDDNFVNGSALIKAYDLENTIAIYPRIVINPENISQFIQSDFQRSILTKDYSNIYYINSFACYFKYISRAAVEKTLKVIKERIETKLCETNNDKHYIKICWFTNLYNDFCRNNDYKKYCINIDNYPYNPWAPKVIVSGQRR